MRYWKTPLAIVFGILLFSTSALATFHYDERGLLQFRVDKSTTESLIMSGLDAVPRTVIDTHTENVKVKNYRTWLEHGQVHVYAEYDYRRRGYTDVGGRRVYTRWVSDTGWVELKVLLEVRDWVVRAFVPGTTVRWSSNNWTTNAIVRTTFFHKISGMIAENINGNIGHAFGAIGYDLREMFQDFGHHAVSEVFGVSQSEAKYMIFDVMDRYRTDADIYPYGIEFSMRVGFNVYLRNKCHRDIELIVSYKDPLFGWRTLGTWDIGGDATSRLVTDNIPLVTNNRVFYYTARSTDGESRWTGNHSIDYYGQSLNMKKKTIEREGDEGYFITLRCD